MGDAKETAERLAAYSDAVFAVIVTGNPSPVRLHQSTTPKRIGREPCAAVFHSPA